MVSLAVSIRRALLASAVLVLPAAAVLSPASPAGPAAAVTGGSSSTTALTLLPGTTTTTTTTAPAPVTAPPTTPGATTSTTVRAPGVPAVPVAGPPTTPTSAGTPPPAPGPQPDINPIVTQVDADLAQISAINEYKPALALVAQAQTQVTAAGATLLSARQALAQAQASVATAEVTKSEAQAKLRQLALAAYMGMGFTNPNPPGANRSQRSDQSVPTPGGLQGVEAADAQELLALVGQHAKDNAVHAGAHLADAQAAEQRAQQQYDTDQKAVIAAENGLIDAQQTLQIITTAAITPGAAAASDLPALQLDAAQSALTNPSSAPTTTTTTRPSRTAKTTLAGAVPIQGPPAVSPAILSPPVLSATQMQAWWATINRQPNITVPINQLIQSYADWGQKLGVRDDIAFAQSIVETGYFSFPSYGQLTPKDNNFAGIGACDTCAHGWSFPSADTGVQAQLELLHLYATNQPWPSNIPNVIGRTGVGGCCQTWTQLAGKWASSTTYGIAIMTVYDQMLQWLIPQEEQAMGLIAASAPPPAQGPELAPLPTTTTTSTTSTTVPPKH